MIVTDIYSIFDFNPALESKNATEELIETIKNLQYNILQELHKPRINKNYIDECNIKIEEIINEIIDNEL